MPNANLNFLFFNKFLLVGTIRDQHQNYIFFHNFMSYLYTVISVEYFGKIHVTCSNRFIVAITILPFTITIHIEIRDDKQ